MIDFHCHIDLYSDPAAVLNEAETRGVYVLAVTTTPKAWAGNLKLVAGRRRVRLGLGFHPELVETRYSEIALFEHLVPEARYIGEVGLDGSPEHSAGFDRQRKIFERILRASSMAGGRVLSLHSRRAAGAVMDCLDRFPDAGTAILHWFSGDRSELDRAIRRGCWFSVGPSMLTSAKGMALAKAMPRDRVLTETDAPFARIKGRPLNPWDVDGAYVLLAEAWGCDVETARGTIRENLRTLGRG
ncbi:Qat anti-phage system TatD family nuclease QatD [Chenggangzhangella methanolivorans]|uniref:TatD family hydrolase n=1 Tax=Chenggangzhangella methanolivorans TaxID=1437009 RepID=A0A9E6RC10_9HYPH|nr:Qat anti-phage system TatD family nuclease QatD [Chenggangzhangella methanolivorans]QZO00534.1 TatD family hydrolase [Chenggangzhangella methanolivorans]